MRHCVHVPTLASEHLPSYGMFGWAAHDGTSWVLGLIFVGIGVLKATNSNALMRSKFDNYATVFPLNELAPWATPHIDSLLYMQCVGIAEILLGVCTIGIAGKRLKVLSAGAMVRVLMCALRGSPRP